MFIAGVLPNTADNLIDWIVDQRAYSPGSAMPVTGVSKAEARDIASWLYAHSPTASSPPSGDGRAGSDRR